jgi:hypothetical protein
MSASSVETLSGCVEEQQKVEEGKKNGSVSLQFHMMRSMVSPSLV